MRLTLLERKTEVPGVESFIFERPAGLTYTAGQFFHYVLHHEPTDERGSDRWFTCAMAPSEGKVMITTRLAADKSSSFKHTLAALKPGEAIEISDVDGDFTLGDQAGEYVFMAGGIGITPFRSMLVEADKTGVALRATLLYANRDEEVPYRAELDALAARNANLKIVYLTGKLDEAAVRAAVADLGTPTFYVSGPEPMVESLGAMLKGMGIPPERLKQDWFPGYPAE